MAEVAVLALSLLQIITPQLLKRLNLQLEVKVEIKNMESWLTFMQAYVEDNYGRRDSKTLLDLLRKVGQTIFDIEDIVDESNRLSLLDSFNIVELGRRLNMPEKVARVKNAIETLKEQKAFASNSINPPPSPTSTSISISPLLHLNDEMVGYENLKEEFMTRLVRGDKRLVALAVDGPPGSGKTWFVNSIFSESRIVKAFKFRGFVSGVGKASTDVILQKLCESMQVPEEGSSDPKSRLWRFLDGKRYLIVVDDVWRWRVDDWKNLKDSLPISCKRSRLIVTTRSSNVSAICDHVTSLQGLEQRDALELFVRRAFPNRECPSELKGITKDFVSRCGGLPLAIVAVARALAQRPQNLHEWERFLGSLGCELWTNADLGAINDSLLRSYMELSSSLKCCLLYMSIFPEDLPVGRGRLIRLWVAEGFAIATNCRTAEEVAEGYLNQLVQSNLILVSDSDFRNNFRLSYPIRNFVVRKSKEENIATVFSESQAINREQTRPWQSPFHVSIKVSTSPRVRTFLDNTDRSKIKLINCISRSKRETDPSDSDFEKNLSQLRLIKVLDVQGANISNFTKKITSRLALVRYLSFKDTNIESIPTSIRNLSHLETLDLRRTHLTELPSEISDLHSNLRHLLASKHDEASGSVQGIELAEGTIISKLTKLQSLSLIKVDPSGRILKDLKALTQLRKLGLTGVRGEHGKDLCAALELIKSLETLDITASEGERIELEEAMESPPKSLRRLYLEGRLEKIPAWISGLDGAVRIDLKQSEMKDSPLEALKGLGNLKELRLINCFAGEELRFEEGDFKKLEIIVMEDLANLSRLKVGSGAAPKLKRILVRRCPLLIKPFRVGRLVEYDKEEDIDGRDYGINKWIDRARSFVPDRIHDKIDPKLRRISGRR